MKIAVEGCCHGELDKIYETIEYLEQKNNVKMDLLIICGDFQAARNKSDMLCMAVPEKYREMKTFHKYYSGEKTAPLLTIFVGGNHEASNYLQELPYGGWVAPNIYYMGYANVIQVGGVRIAGCSGIYKGHNAQRGHFEHPPYTEDAKRSAYHVRALEIFRLKQISRPIDIFVSHDWPRNIWKYGNVQALLKRKPDFQKDMDDNRLGNPFHEELLYHLKPKYWFAAHLHIKFPAAVLHESNDGESKITKFLSLDKCLPRRKFLQVLDVPHDTEKPISIQLDPEWLAILKSTNHLLNLKTSHKYLPGPGGKERWNFKVKHEEMNAIIEDFGEDLAIPENFKQTVDVYDPSERNPSLPKTMINPQTSLICEMLDITDPNAVFLGKDTKFNLTVDDYTDDSVDGENDDEDDDVDDDTESESFMSFDQSDQSLSFLSSSNADDSIVSLGVSMNASVDEKDKVSSLNNSFANEDTDEEAKAITENQKPDQSIDKSTSPSKSSLSQSDVEDIDPELLEILAEQKAKRQLKLTKDSGQVELALTESDDEELASMLAEQKKAQSVQDVSLNESVTHDLSVNDPPSLISEDTLPLSQSSPASSGERSDSEVVKATHGLVLSEDKETRKRGDGSETEESPQSKKFRRRNQSLYESGSEMSS